MERPISNSGHNDLSFEGINFAQDVLTPGQPAVLFLKERGNPAGGIDTTQHLIPETAGRTVSYLDHLLTLDTLFTNRAGTFNVDKYITIAGKELELLIRSSCDNVDSDDPYLRANAVTMSGIAPLLGLVADTEAIAVRCLDWAMAHDGMLEQEEMVALIYAYITTRQEPLLESALSHQLESSPSLEGALRQGFMLSAYLTTTTDYGANAAQQLTALANLLKKS